MFVSNIIMSWVLNLTSHHVSGVVSKTVSNIDDDDGICYNEIFSFWQDLNNGCVSHTHYGLAIYIF